MRIKHNHYLSLITIVRTVVNSFKYTEKSFTSLSSRLRDVAASAYAAYEEEEVLNIFSFLKKILIGLKVFLPYLLSTPFVLQVFLITMLSKQVGAQI